MLAEDACSRADMSKPQMRDFAATHLITASDAFKAVMHPAGSILVGCTCEPIVALGEQNGAGAAATDCGDQRPVRRLHFRPALRLRPTKDLCAAITVSGALAGSVAADRDER